jgi:hypothetical protein
VGAIETAPVVVFRIGLLSWLRSCALAVWCTWLNGLSVRVFAGGKYNHLNAPTKYVLGTRFVSEKERLTPKFYAQYYDSGTPCGRWRHLRALLD